MTDNEMRKRLAEAMGWTDLQDVSPCGRMRGLWGTEPAGWFSPGSPARASIIAPDPLESDRDAARLRAWCVGHGLGLQIVCLSVDAPGGPGSRVGVYRIDHNDMECRVAEVWVWADAEPDPCRRERLALCQAVLQALEVQR